MIKYGDGHNICHIMNYIQEMYGNANFLERSESELEEENDERGIISEDDGLEGDDDDEIGNQIILIS